jgi:CubicO group peptidase (beta-lactamase class C family)
MKRRTFIQSGLAVCLGNRVLGALRRESLEEATGFLTRATATGEVSAAVLHVRQADGSFTQAFGKAPGEQAMFLLGSISKPIAVTALMTLFDRGAFRLDDPLQKFLPQFQSGNREQVTMQHLLTHTSGLPDQLAENNELRAKHASLGEFAEHAARAPLSFTPGTKYQYSSMAILLASRVAEILSSSDIRQLVNQAVFQPLKMAHSAQGLGRFKLEDVVLCQTDRAAPESGGGDPHAKEWDWNSSYWRNLGAPWGGAHCSAPDLGTLLTEFLHPTGAAVKQETAQLMIRNHNAAGLMPRGLGWAIDAAIGTKGISERTFGHTGSTGTIAWADPVTETICVVLTSLPAKAEHPHPRDLAADAVAGAAASPPPGPPPTRQ